MRGAVVARAFVVAACVVTSVAATAAAQMRDASDQLLAAVDGTTFVVTRGAVKVPELRGADAEPSRTIRNAASLRTDTDGHSFMAQVAARGLTCASGESSSHPGSARASRFQDLRNRGPALPSSP